MLLYLQQTAMDGTALGFPHVCGSEPQTKIRTLLVGDAHHLLKINQNTGAKRKYAP